MKHQQHPSRSGPAIRTKAGYLARVERAKRLLIDAGFNVDEPGTGLAIDALMREFGIQRRTAQQLEAKAARLLRGEAVEIWTTGRPRNAELSDYQRRQYDRLKARAEAEAGG